MSVRGPLVTALTVVAMGVGFTAAAAQLPDGLELLERAAVRYQAVGSLCADFVQRLEVPLLGEDRTGTGRLCQAGPDRFAMRFDDPAGDLVVLDGESVWIYLPSNDDNVVIRIAAGGSAGGYDLHREFLERPAEKYAVIETMVEDHTDGSVTLHVDLAPREPTSYDSARLSFDRDMTLRRIRIEEDNGTVRTVTLNDVTFEPADLDPSFFAFRPPPGAQVISR